MVERNTIVGLNFLISGVIIALLGYVLVQSIPITAFGFALAVIGSVMLLVVSEPIPQDTFKSLLKDSISNVEIILEESSLHERAYFFPSGSEEQVRALVPFSQQIVSTISSQSILQSIEKLQRRFIVNSGDLRGLLVVPPGSELVNLVKVEKGSDIEDSLSSTLVGFSDLAGSVSAISEESVGQIRIEIRKPKITSDSISFNECLGSPVSCVASCVVAKCVGSPVRIVDEKFQRAMTRLTLQIIK